MDLAAIQFPNPASERATPTLSVVVISFNSPEILIRCLDALVRQAESPEVEVLAVGRWSSRPEFPALQDRFPAVRWISAGDREPVPLMRSRGIRCCRGPVVALLEDDCLVAPDWCRCAIDAHRTTYPAIGGPIEPDDYGTGRDWGIYFCEYGRFMAPFQGVVPHLPGNNVTYKMEALDPVALDRGFYEVFSHARWQREGEHLFAVDGLRVQQINRWSREAITQVPFHHGRAFAGMRLAGRPWWTRFFFAGLVPLLPLLQTMRLGREVLRRRRLIGRYLAALPWIWLFTASWACGEWVGTVLGPGQSASRWL